MFHGLRDAVPVVDLGTYDSKSDLGGSLLRNRIYRADLGGVVGRPVGDCGAPAGSEL